MRGIHLSQHFAQHFGKIIIVVDKWKEFPVHGFVLIPIHPVKVFHIKFFFELSPCMVKNVIPFLSWFQHHLPCGFQGFGLSSIRFHPDRFPIR